jgi:hypothetical protein
MKQVKCDVKNLTTYSSVSVIFVVKFRCEMAAD